MSRSLVWKLCWVQTTCGLCCWPWLWPPLSYSASCCLSVPRAPASCSSTSTGRRRHAMVHNNTSTNILQWHTTLLLFLLLCIDGLQLQHLRLHLALVFLVLLCSLSEFRLATPFFSMKPVQNGSCSRRKETRVSKLILKTITTTPWTSKS